MGWHPAVEGKSCRAYAAACKHDRYDSAQLCFASFLLLRPCTAVRIHKQPLACNAWLYYNKSILLQFAFLSRHLLVGCWMTIHSAACSGSVRRLSSWRAALRSSNWPPQVANASL